jgi:hypothetical protein
MRKKLKQSSDGGDSGSKKWKRGYGDAYGGVWRSLLSGDGFCVAAFSSRREDVFTFNLFHKEIF